MKECGKFSCATRRRGAPFGFTFCPNCGTSLYWEGDFNANLCVVAVGAFADPTFPPPSVSVFEQSKHEWVHLADDITHAQRGRSHPTPDDHESDAG
ncbi:GFA family protein [Rhizobium sp. H4]|uniref:GFA family protein n=1 Tax=Rhizobium sp. H4 TaxID=2035449 RepID=UPI002477D6C9|nr:GFA family protein [Rhizobium sp. H4]